MIKVVSWNCNGGFRNKYRYLFEAYPNADIYIVQECEDPDFYEDYEFRKLFANGFHAGSPEVPFKGIAVLVAEGHSFKRQKYQRGEISTMSYAPFILDGTHIIHAVWTHGKYVEEFIDYIRQNDKSINNRIVMIGDTNSSSEFDYQHRKDKNHTALVNLLKERGLVDAYNYLSNEEEGKESIETFYLQRNKDKAFHLDRAFIAPEKLISYKVAENHDYWLSYSDHIPIELIFE